MTHGYIWIPLNGKMLLCEAWSDGYIEGVGFGALCSSQKIETISKLSEIFYGSPFFYEPSSDIYIAKENDYLIEGYSDIINDQALLMDAEKTLEYVLDNNLDAAFNTDFAKLDLNTRIDLGIGINAEMVENDLAWKNFTQGTIELNLSELCDLLIETYKTEDLDINSLAQTVYYWKDKQFFVNMEMNGHFYIVPLIIACAFMNMENIVYGDVDYLKNMTEKDKETLKILKNTLQKHNISVNIMFAGSPLNLQ